MRHSRYWTAAATKNGEEQRAAYNVERQDFAYYLPVAAVNKGGVVRRELLFPGYIFIKIREGWQSLMSTRGIKSLFLCEGRPTRMADAEIESMVSREDERGLIQLEPPVTRGDRVVVQYGPMEGLLGRVKSLTSRERCLVLLSVMNRTVETEIDRAALRVRA